MVKGIKKAPVLRFRKTGALTWRRPTLTPDLAGTTIGGGRLDARVRNGNGYFPSPMTTRCYPAERNMIASVSYSTIRLEFALNAYVVGN